ncbi:MAG TPA: alpha-L-arabinofuranosidase C-terminal domain-containing protein, partial [Puia sp.]
WDEARNWVEYCNAPTGFYYSDLRAKNGHAQPYHVKYWGLGNEMDGDWQMGHRNADDYSKFALEAAKLMRWSDDSIKLIASGSSNYGDDWINWNKTILNNMRDVIDYISLHHYSGNYHKDHYEFMNSTLWVENVIKITEGLINEVRTQNKMQKPIYIAFDEYNVWYRAFNEQKLEEHYNMQDVLVVAMYLNTFLRHANIVKMTNMAQLVNVIAPMMVTNDKLWLQTIYYPLQLFATNCNGYALDAFVQCETYDDKDYKKIPYLDVSSSYNDKTEEITINVVNKNESKAIETSIVNEFGKLETKATVYEINSANMMDENSVNEQKVKPAQKEINIKGDNFDYTFPAHSFTMIKLKIKS